MKTLFVCGEEPEIKNLLSTAKILTEILPLSQTTTLMCRHRTPRKERQPDARR
jgi:hypothetical protein